MSEALVTIHGRKFGLGNENQLISEGIDITQPCVNATVTVGAEASNVRAITIQLLDANGNDIAYVEEVDIVIFLTNTRVSYVATGGSTGIAIGTDGALSTIIAKKVFRATSEADGDLDLTWTDTGTEVAFIGVRLPNGRYVMGSQALTNA